MRSQVLLPLMMPLVLAAVLVGRCGAVSVGTPHQQPASGGQQTPRAAPHGRGILGDKEKLEDKKHLQEHLKNEITQEELDSMTPLELHYHYFRVHDYDNNLRLDGLELLTAFGHMDDHDGEGETGLNTRDIEKIAEMVDDALREYDMNNDGFLSFAEYRRGQQL